MVVHGTVHSGCTDRTKATAHLVRAVLGTKILSNGKGHFGPTDRNERTGQSGPPSKVVPNIPVGPNQNDPFHLISNGNLRNFGLNGKRTYTLMV